MIRVLLLLILLIFSNFAFASCEEIQSDSNNIKLSDQGLEIPWGPQNPWDCDAEDEDQEFDGNALEQPQSFNLSYLLRLKGHRRVRGYQPPFLDYPKRPPRV
jgi:hypothetical protein